MTDALWAVLDALFYPPLCRLGFHRWETPPFLHMFAIFPQHRDYEQCTRFGCWKKRYIDDACLRPR
jgi:hypothetical protein